MPIKDRRTKEQILEENSRLKSQLDIAQQHTSNENKKDHTKNLFRLEVANILLVIASVILAGVAAYLTHRQTDIMAHQDALMETQTRLMSKQTELLGTQTIQFNKQNDLLGNQNDLVTVQNGKIEDQNKMIGMQTISLSSQNRLFLEQNSLLKNQNEKIDKQVLLDEASRRSSLNFLLSNILDAVDNELEKAEDYNYPRRLSPQLIGRIASLSQSFQPYRFLDSDTMISKPLSPERGSLLLALLHSNLDTLTLDTIFQNTDFNYAFLKNAHIIRGYLKGANLRDADLSQAVLYKCDFSHADLSGTNLHYSNLAFANFYATIFSNTDFQDAWVSPDCLSELEKKNIEFLKKTNNLNENDGILDLYIGFGISEILREWEIRSGVFQKYQVGNEIFNVYQLQRKEQKHR